MLWPPVSKKKTTSQSYPFLSGLFRGYAAFVVYLSEKNVYTETMIQRCGLLARNAFFQ